MSGNMDMDSGQKSKLVFRLGKKGNFWNLTYNFHMIIECKVLYFVSIF